MESMTLIAITSIVIAGFATSIGCVAPALAEGRSVASALTSLAQQPDASSTITRTLFVVSMILIFANPFWNYAVAAAAAAAGK
jgi:F-type H+-transporting ATPase subunit c